MQHNPRKRTHCCDRSSSSQKNTVIALPPLPKHGESLLCDIQTQKCQRKRLDSTTACLVTLAAWMPRRRFRLRSPLFSSGGQRSVRRLGNHRPEGRQGCPGRLCPRPAPAIISHRCRTNAEGIASHRVRQKIAFLPCSPSPLSYQHTKNHERLFNVQTGETK